MGEPNGGWGATAVAVLGALAALVGLTAWLSLDSPTARGARETRPDTAAPDADRARDRSTEAPPALAPDPPAPGIPTGPAAPASASAAVGGGPPAPPITQIGDPLTTASVEEIVASAVDAVVQIETPNGRGTGFFVAPDTLLTNVHVIGSRSSVTIKRASGQTTTARVTTTAPTFDIAVLRVSNADRSTAILPMGSALNARVGQDVIAIGSALGTLQNTVTRGIVSAVRQSGRAVLVQTDAAINPGNSGGPLIDRQGRAIGITTMGYVDRQGLSFAVAIDHARGVLDGTLTDLPGAVAGSPLASAESGDFSQRSPAVSSDTERARADGVRLYDEALNQWAAEADALDDVWQRFRRACNQTGQSHGSHGWFLVLEGPLTTGRTAPSCGQWLADIHDRATAIERAILAADEAARRADVYPGARRESRRRHRLDHAGWDR